MENNFKIKVKIEGIKKKEFKSKKRVFIVGVGLSKFTKPSETRPDYIDFAKLAAHRALRDAGITYDNI